MTKAELIANLVKSNKSLSKKAAGDVVDALFVELKKAIKKDSRFSLPGFGTFTVRKRAARNGINPQTKKPIKIKASKTVAFKPAPKFKSSL
jgi:DNA-binding protein HU-beta